MDRKLLIAVILVLLGISIVLLLISSSVQRLTEGEVEISGVKLYVDSVSQDTTTITAVVSIRNSFPVGVDLRGGNLSLELNDIKFASASIPGQAISGSSTSDVIVKIRMNNGMIDDMWYSHLRRGERSNFCVRGSISIDTPVGAMNLPVESYRVLKTHIFPMEKEIDEKLDLGPLGYVAVRKVRIELSNVTPSETRMVVSVLVDNEAEIPVPITNLALRLKLQDGSVLAEGYQRKIVIVGSGESRNVVFDVVLHNSELPRAWYLHIKNGETSKIGTEVQIYIKLAGNVYTLTVHSETIEERTDLFEHGCG